LAGGDTVVGAEVSGPQNKNGVVDAGIGLVQQYKS